MKRALRYLFVCSGNICRSPMAEVMARDILEQAGVRAEVGSAGTLGIEGHPTDPLAIEVLRQLGYDLRAHRSRGVIRKLLRRSDGILVMAPENEIGILALDSEAHLKVDRLWEYSASPERLTCIVDPIGEGLEVFVRCRDDILECLKNWVSRHHAHP